SRDRLHRATRRLRHLSTSPENQPHRRRLKRRERLHVRTARNGEVDEEDRDEDRQTAEELDVEANHCSRRPEVDREQRAEQYPDRYPAVQVARPTDHAPTTLSRRSSRRTNADRLQTSAR